MAVVVKKPAPVYKATKLNPYPSAPQAKKAVNTPGGPALHVNTVKKTVGKVGPGHKPDEGPTKTIRRDLGPGGLRVLRPKSKMLLRVGVPKETLRGAKVVKKTAQARKGLLGAGTAKVVTKTPAGGKTVQTAGKTKIVGPKGNVLVVKKGSSVFRNKAKGTITRATSGPDMRSKVVKRFGVNTATKADNTRAVKKRSPNRARLTVTGPGGRSTTVARRASAPRKVVVTNRTKTGEVRSRKVIGAKKTRLIGPKGDRTVKTRYISKQRRENVTPQVGEKGWRRGNTKPKKTAAKKSAVPTAPNVGAASSNPNEARGTYRDTPGFRRKRRKQGARYNLSLTKGQLKSTTSRRLS